MPLNLPFRPRRTTYPPDLWTKCPSCEEMLFNKQLDKLMRVCPTCGHHFRLTAAARLEQLVDQGTFRERDAGLQSVDPLGFVDQKPYPDRLAAAVVATGIREAVVWGTAAIEGTRLAIAVMDFGFMGGSMGSVVGEKVTRAIEGALADRLPLVIVSASGGARMQEGTYSLMQLVKTIASLERLRAGGLPFVSVMADPTTGGVFASYAILGDVNLAEPNALIGFAGARVGAGTIAQELPPGFQRAEFLFAHGFVDRVVERRDLRHEVGTVLRYLVPRPPAPSAPVVESMFGAASPATGAASTIHSPSGTAATPAPAAMMEPVPSAPAGGASRSRGLFSSLADIAEDIAERVVPDGSADGRAARARHEGAAAQIAAPPPHGAEDPAAARERVWSRVQLARNLRRPRTLEILAHIGEDFVELHGDRLFGDDPAVVAGLARIGGSRVAIVGHQKGAETDENIRRNFGMPHPEGYRKAIRVMELAERFGMPVITLIDVPGAHPGSESEERGIADAIARSIGVMSGLRTPIVAVITGEGGSGGALAIAVGDVVVALENAVYSVISPEGCAAILWRTSDRAAEAAVAMKMTAAEQQALGVVDIVVPEPGEGAHTDHAETARRLRSVIVRQLDILGTLPIDELLEQRYLRYRRMGPFEIVEPTAPPERPIPGLTDRLRTLIEAGRQAVPAVPLPGLPSLPGVPLPGGPRRDEPPARDEV